MIVARDRTYSGQIIFEFLRSGYKKLLSDCLTELRLTSLSLWEETSLGKGKPLLVLSNLWRNGDPLFSKHLMLCEEE